MNYKRPGIGTNEVNVLCSVDANNEDGEGQIGFLVSLRSIDWTNGTRVRVSRYLVVIK